MKANHFKHNQHDYITYASIVGLVIAIIVLVVLRGDIHGAVVYDLPDKCGPIMNFISHTIPDEDSCYSQCKTRCESRELTFKKAYFTPGEVGCNTCTCTCS